MSTSLLSVADQSGVTILSIHAKDLVEHTVAALRPEIVRLFPNSPARWILDLDEVDFIASAGIGLIVQIAHKISAVGGKMGLCLRHPELVQLFQAPYFLKSVAIYGTVPEAIHAMSPH